MIAAGFNKETHMYQDVVVLDLETLNSADDLPTGWKDYNALGLSIGGYYDYGIGGMHFFQQGDLYLLMNDFVFDEPLIVTFNGIAFDLKLMRWLIRSEADRLGPGKEADEMMETCDKFKVLANKSYDILAEISRADSKNKFAPGLNSLDAICEANGLGNKIGPGALAPKWWQAGDYDRVISYLAYDVYLTRKLFELIQENKGVLKRSNGELRIRTLEEVQVANEVA